MFTRTIPWQLRLPAILAVLVSAAACDAGGAVRPSAARLDPLALSQSASTHAIDLGSCTNLAVTAPARAAARLYAVGTQNYFWNGSAWLFTGPEAELFPNATGRGTVGIHYAGPTWESNSGSAVVGQVVDRCTPDANAIPWLLLSAVSSRGPGIFDGTTYIQRLATVGGLAPTAPGAAYGDVVKVPYTAEYVFYR